MSRPDPHLLCQCTPGWLRGANLILRGTMANHEVASEGQSPRDLSCVPCGLPLGGSHLGAKQSVGQHPTPGHSPLNE